MTIPRIEKRIRVASVFLLAGLLVEALSLLRISALSFVLFTVVGIPLFVIGAILFLIALPGIGSEHPEP